MFKKQTNKQTNIFDKYLTPFWKMFCGLNNCSMLNYQTIMCQSSKNYGSPTRVTKLKLALNMADMISILNTQSVVLDIRSENLHLQIVYIKDKET